MRINKGVIAALLIIMIIYYFNSLDIRFNPGPEGEIVIPQIGTTIKTDLGRYQGLVDNNCIEIKLTGVPEILANRTFVIPEHLKISFEDMDLCHDDIIKFNYIENEHGQFVILNIFPQTITS